MTPIVAARAMLSFKCKLLFIPAYKISRCIDSCIRDEDVMVGGFFDVSCKAPAKPSPFFTSLLPAPSEYAVLLPALIVFVCIINPFQDKSALSIFNPLKKTLSMPVITLRFFNISAENNDVLTTTALLPKTIHPGHNTGSYRCGIGQWKRGRYV